MVHMVNVNHRPKNGGHNSGTVAAGLLNTGCELARREKSAAYVEPKIEKIAGTGHRS